MTNYSRYSGRGKKPIRKDRVAIAVLFLAMVIVLPILLRSLSSGPVEPLIVTSDTPVTADDATTADLNLPDLGTAEDDGGLPELPDTVDTPPASEDILTYTVRDGETIADVAFELGISRSSLLASNQLLGTEQLQPGQTLYGTVDGVLHLIKSGQTLTDISLTYAVPVEAIAAANNLSAGATIYAGTRIIIPGVLSTFWDDVVQLSHGVHTRFIWPVEAEITSTFGWRVHPVLGNRHHHDGIDLDIPEGTLIHAAASGRVYFSGEQPGYGNVLILEHADGFYTVYGHLSSALVYKGQYVEVGQAIAQSGNTGISDGPHLHFEVRNGEFPVDPLRYLP